MKTTINSRNPLALGMATSMNREQVQELEVLLEQALATAFRQSKVARILSRNQSPPTAKTLHLMAKAAVTVLEATEMEGE